MNTLGVLLLAMVMLGVKIISDTLCQYDSVFRNTQDNWQIIVHEWTYLFLGALGTLIIRSL